MPSFQIGKLLKKRLFFRASVLQRFRRNLKLRSELGRTILKRLDKLADFPNSRRPSEDTGSLLRARAARHRPAAMDDIAVSRNNRVRAVNRITQRNGVVERLNDQCAAERKAERRLNS